MAVAKVEDRASDTEPPNHLQLDFGGVEAVLDYGGWGGGVGSSTREGWDTMGGGGGGGGGGKGQGSRDHFYL